MNLLQNIIQKIMNKYKQIYMININKIYNKL